MQTALALDPITRDAYGRIVSCLPSVVLQIDKPRDCIPFAGPLDRDPGPGGCGEPPSPPHGAHRRIHVISTYAGGEIRSYELTSDGRLLLAYPCYTGLWLEMDAEVTRITGQAGAL